MTKILFHNDAIVANPFAWKKSGGKNISASLSQLSSVQLWEAVGGKAALVEASTMRRAAVLLLVAPLCLWSTLSLYLSLPVSLSLSLCVSLSSHDEESGSLACASCAPALLRPCVGSLSSSPARLPPCGASAQKWPEAEKWSEIAITSIDSTTRCLLLDKKCRESCPTLLLPCVPGSLAPVTHKYGKIRRSSN